jgi:hypothetical protein
VGDGEIGWVSILDYIVKFEYERNEEELKKITGICFIENNGRLFFTN